jgi:hypothetical protein
MDLSLGKLNKCDYSWENKLKKIRKKVILNKNKVDT